MVAARLSQYRPSRDGSECMALTRSTRTEAHFLGRGWSHSVSRVPCVLVLFTITVVIDLGGLVNHWLLRDRVSTAHDWFRVQHANNAWHELGQPHYRGPLSSSRLVRPYFTITPSHGEVTCTMHGVVIELGQPQTRAPLYSSPYRMFGQLRPHRRLSLKAYFSHWLIGCWVVSKVLIAYEWNTTWRYVIFHIVHVI